MSLQRILLSTLTLLAFRATPQSVVPAHAGLVYFFETGVSIDGQPIAQVNGRFQQIPEGSVLDTNAGRAEILLGPDLFLWLAPNSSVKMLCNNLDDTRVELLTGEAFVQSAELTPDSAVRLIQRDAEIQLSGKAFYRLDAGSSLLTVVNGEAALTLGQNKLVVNEPKRVLLSSGFVEAIPKSKPDAMDLWVQQRQHWISAYNRRDTQRLARLESRKNKHQKQGRMLGPILPPFPIRIW